MNPEQVPSVRSSAPEVLAAALKAQEWVSYGRPAEFPKSWDDLTHGLPKVNTVSEPSPQAHYQADRSEGSERQSYSLCGTPLSIIPKESGRKVESPKDDNAPSPKPLLTIAGAVPQSGIKKRKREPSTKTIKSFIWSPGPSDLSGKVLRSPDSDSSHDWNRNHAIPARPPEINLPCVPTWIAGIEEAPDVDETLVQYPNPTSRDFNTFTGEWADPYEYPHTMKNLDEVRSIGDDSVRWRWENMTSSLWMKESQARAEMQRIEAEHSEAMYVARRALPPEIIQWPAAVCLLRPVREEDCEEVAGIINLEAKDDTSPQVIEQQPVEAEQVNQLRQQCDREHYPFIVAVSSLCPLLDKTKWPEESDKEYQEFVKFKKSQPPEEERVLGFAYVTTSRLGFSGEPCYGSRHSGQIKLLVHPDHRRKLVGTALLDRILMSVHTCHRSLVDYKWQCEDRRGVYEKATVNNCRQYTDVEIITFCRKDDEDGLKKQKRLVEKYGFQLKHQLEEEVKVNKGYGSSWLDVFHWRLTVRGRLEMPDQSPKVETDH